MTTPVQDDIDLSEWLTLKACADRLPRRNGQRMSLAALYRWILSGKLPAVRIGRIYYVHPQDLADLAKPVEKRKRQAPLIGTSRAQRAMDRETDELLRKHGLK